MRRATIAAVALLSVSLSGCAVFRTLWDLVPPWGGDEPQPRPTPTEEPTPSPEPTAEPTPSPTVTPTPTQAPTFPPYEELSTGAYEEFPAAVSTPRYSRAVGDAITLYRQKNPGRFYASGCLTSDLFLDDYYAGVVANIREESGLHAIVDRCKCGEIQVADPRYLDLATGYPARAEGYHVLASETRCPRTKYLGHSEPAWWRLTEAVPPPEPTTTATPEPRPTEPPVSSACPSPIPPAPCGWWGPVRHSPRLYDSTLLVCGLEYCTAAGFTDRRRCPVRPEGHPDRGVCEFLAVGGVGWPRWSLAGDDCQTPEAACSYTANPYQAAVLGGAGLLRVCASNGTCAEVEVSQ